MRTRTLTLATLAIALCIGADTATADRYNSKPRFGIGLELGAPTGLSGKYFLGGQVAVQGGVGVIRQWYRYEDALHAHAELVWHPAVIHRSRAVTIPLHLGVGARLLDEEGYCWDGNSWFRCDNDTHLGIRAPIGVSFLLGNVPMDIFVELAMVIDVLEFDDNDYMHDHDRAGLDGVMGARYYF